MESIICPSSQICSGCSEWKIPYPKQLENKKEYLKNKIGFSNIEILSIAPYGFRDHFDFTIEEGRLGLYSHQIQFIVDLPDCLQLSPKLREFYLEFRRIKWPIQKGSVRLRVSPSGIKGAWLDFSNLDIKKLFEEENALLQLMKICHVEIGQRKKTLTKQDRLKLEDPSLRPWSRTWMQENEIPLYGTIASFTQAGDRSNQLLISEISQLTAQKDLQNILEYGCGNGNITFSMLNMDRKISVLETEALSLLGLQKTAEKLGLTDRIKILDPKNLNSTIFQKKDLIVANPPRSGLTKFLAQMGNSLPPFFLYMSCFPETFARDAQQLKELHYIPKNIRIVDQFPQTKHFEIISMWEQKT